VLSQGDGWEKISLDKSTIDKHLDILLAHPAFAENIRSIFESRDPIARAADPEARLYDDFVGNGDRIRIEAVRNADVSKLADFHPEFNDDRLPELLLHYKARNFPRSLSESEQVDWESWRASRIEKQLVKVC